MDWKYLLAKPKSVIYSLVHPSVVTPFHCNEFTVTEDCKFEPYIQSKIYYLQNLQVNEESPRVGGTSFAHILVGLRMCLILFYW